MDINYWENFYVNKNIVKEPSDFCIFIMNYFKDSEKIHILDAGCGNGRDSLYMSNKYKVTGLDTSLVDLKDSINCNFIKTNFCNYDKTNFNMIYSRFTFHSISNEDQEIFLKSITKDGTYLCIETRSDKDINNNRVFGDNHYRNFTNLNYLKNILEKNKFEILYIVESNNVAIYKDENPINQLLILYSS